MKCCLDDMDLFHSCYYGILIYDRCVRRLQMVTLEVVCHWYPLKDVQMDQIAPFLLQCISLFSCSTLCFGGPLSLSLSLSPLINGENLNNSLIKIIKAHVQCI